MQGQTKSKDFQKIIGLVRQKIVDKLLTNCSFKLTKTIQIIVFLLTTDNYLAFLTKYLVAEYLVGHYSAEYSADRIIGRSLVKDVVASFSLIYMVFSSVRNLSRRAELFVFRKREAISRTFCKIKK
jgi:hypothetical protein